VPVDQPDRDDPLIERCVVDQLAHAAEAASRVSRRGSVVCSHLAGLAEARQRSADIVGDRSNQANGERLGNSMMRVIFAYVVASTTSTYVHTLRLVAHRLQVCEQKRSYGAIRSDRRADPG
jgi:hypothetical protein